LGAMESHEKAFISGAVISGVTVGGLAVALALANVSAREQLSAALLEDTYGDCLSEELTNPTLSEMSYSLLDRHTTVNAPVEGEASYLYRLEPGKDDGLVLVPGDEMTWTRLAEAGCPFPEIE